MIRTVLLVAVSISVCSICIAADPPTGETTLRVYSVGDLVSAAVMNGSLGAKPGNPDRGSIPAETLKALEDLRAVVESTCLQKPFAVKCYAPALSLIVRHTDDGHAEIEQLLRDLGKSNQPTIQMHCRGLFGFEEVASQNQRLEVLLLKRYLSKAETAELIDMLPEGEEIIESVALVSGRRTSWGHADRACTAIGRIDHSSKRIDIRFDYVTGDDYADPPLFGSQVFSLADGESALFNHHYDGGTVTWLVTASSNAHDKLASKNSKPQSVTVRR